MYGHVITKFSRMGRLPHFLSYGAPPTRGALHCAWSSASKCSTCSKSGVSTVSVASVVSVVSVVSAVSVVTVVTVVTVVSVVSVVAVVAVVAQRCLRKRYAPCLKTFIRVEGFPPM